MASQSQSSDLAYSLAEVKRLMKQVNTSMSTFYRLAAELDIEKYLPNGQQRGASWNKAQVDALVERRKRKARKKNTSKEKVAPVHQPIEDKATFVPQISASEQAATDWIQVDDLPYVFTLDYEVYGEESTIPPRTTRLWWQKNPYACHILYNTSNRKDIWGALTILPMKEDVILQLLTGDLQEKDITPKQILPYEPGNEYVGYIASVVIRPERRGYFIELVRSIMDFWCEQFPYIHVRKLYAYALGGEGSDGMRLLRKLYFAPRYDIGDGENAWELRLDHYNPSPLVQQFQRCLGKKQADERQKEAEIMITNLSRTTTKERTNAQFLAASSKEDIAAMVDIAEAVFGASGVPIDELVELWHSWWRKNPEVFYVLKIGGVVIGFVSLLPLPRTKIDRILREEQQPKDIMAKDIEMLQPGVPMDIYLHVMTIRPGLTIKDKRTYGMRLLQGLMDVLEKWGQRRVVIRTILTRSRMEDGINLSRQIGFEEIPSRLGVNKLLFQLDVTHASDNTFLRKYKEALKEYDSSHEALDN